MGDIILMKDMKRQTRIAAIVFIAGLAGFLYPMIGGYVSSGQQLRILADYDAASADLTGGEADAIFETAEAYNANLRRLGSDYIGSCIEGYYNTLDITGTGIMGYLSIEKLGLKLPICHGTDSGAMRAGVGHLEGTSLPIGGEGTHCCLTAHRGLPSARLFAELDRLEPGDRFEITVLDRRLVYQVVKLLIVEPSDVSALAAVEGEDLCTLLTCTPYGINSHRLLVRGVRVDDELT